MAWKCKKFFAETLSALIHAPACYKRGASSADKSFRWFAHGDELFSGGGVDADGGVECCFGRPGLEGDTDALDDYAGVGADHVYAQ